MPLVRRVGSEGETLETFIWASDRGGQGEGSWRTFSLVTAGRAWTWLGGGPACYTWDRGFKALRTPVFFRSPSS